MQLHIIVDNYVHTTVAGIQGKLLHSIASRIKSEKSEEEFVARIHRLVEFVARTHRLLARVFIF